MAIRLDSVSPCEVLNLGRGDPFLRVEVDIKDSLLALP